LTDALVLLGVESLVLAFCRAVFALNAELLGVLGLAAAVFDTEAGVAVAPNPKEGVELGLETEFEPPLGADHPDMKLLVLASFACASFIACVFAGSIRSKRDLGASEAAAVSPEGFCANKEGVLDVENMLAAGFRVCPNAGVLLDVNCGLACASWLVEDFTGATVD
jgi:hypothetical protein